MKKSALLMDADAQNLEQLQGMLQRNNYNVLIAADGNAALRLIKTTKPDIIISDLLLAGLNGYEVWEKIRLDEETAHIPILVVSALMLPSANESVRFLPGNKRQTLYYDAFLPKPVDLNRFMRVSDKLIAPEKNRQIASGPTAVIAIDAPDLQQSLTIMLQAHDFGVESSTTLSETQRLVRTTSPAVLILDYRTPTQATRQLIFQIKRLVPNTAIVLVTQADTVEQAIQNEIHSVLLVPLQEDYVTLVIEQVLELMNSRYRNQTLTEQLITTQQNLLESQETLRAQNEELQLVNAKLRELDKLKETFTGMVVHDLKSPLSAVLGALNFTLIDPRISLTDKNRGMLNGAIGAGNQMLRLIETLLEGQRLEDGRVELDLEPFAWEDLVAESSQNILPLLTLHRLEIELAIPNNLPLLYADAHMTQRVLENLLDNAIKFSPRNSSIVISGEPEEAFIKLSVKDMGPGIPKAEQDKIFNRFEQVKNNQAGRSGFGLGLAFCYQAVGAMSGRIWVESDGESGTTFYFTLPIYQEKNFVVSSD
ncbi:ATP-binding protein [Anaerolineales bacterium HSG6]|nr:ATP-binding protein [Anaerolineales bacterium HSG6]MDM8529805.1 ATP-binding protein [Anaerolineales bacterium HSG25]